jgi:hypothetical protein
MAMTIVRRNGDWLSAMVGDELVMMSAESGNYVGISPVGARVWELIERPKSLDELCGQLVREFEVTPETCRADVLRFVEEMQGHGAVALDPATAA